MTRKWAILAAVCTSPLFGIFAYFGDPGRGQAAWVGAGMIAVAGRLLWRLRDRPWYWVTLAVIVGLHVPLILFIRWPFKQYSYMQLLPLGFLDFAVVYGVIRLVERVIEGDSSASTDTSPTPGS